jgi:signal transduction histidine kinase
MLRSSIQRRLIATVILSQALLAAGLLLAGVYYTNRRLLSTLDTGIQSRATSIAALVRYAEDDSGKVYFDERLVPDSLDPGHPDLFAVWTENGGLLTRSKNWPAGLEVPPTGERYWKFKYGHVHYRAVRLTRVPILDREADLPDVTLTVVYAAPTAHLRQQVREAGVFIAGASLLLLIITGLLSLWGIRRGLLPLQELATQASLVSANQWKLHVPEDAEQISELRPLTESMTTMLARLERSFTQQKEFLGNAAHELKTPVAVLKSTLQSLLHRPRSSDEYRRGVEQSLEDLERLERLLQWMLRLARAEQWAHGALRRDLPVVNLGATCEEAVERIRPLAETRHTTLKLMTNGAVMLRADPEDLQLVWVNLLENAVRYSPEGASVEVTVVKNNGAPARVMFQDHGAGIPKADLPYVFERFYRGDPSRARTTGGFGLGLAIAKALVEAYGGAIAVDSEPGVGTRMTVELPVGEQIGP